MRRPPPRHGATFTLSNGCTWCAHARHGADGCPDRIITRDSPDAAKVETIACPCAGGDR